MNAQTGPAAPASGFQIPSFEQLAADPEIAALLDFEPVVRKVKRPDGWTPELQRELIARMAATGTLQRAVDQMGKNASGAEGLYKVPAADSFRAAWDGAIALGRRRNEVDAAPPWVGEIPGIQRRHDRAFPGARGAVDEEAEELRLLGEGRDRITLKLRMARRLYLQEISGCPGKRAAFEILSGFAIDWDKARHLEEQPDEPWTVPNFRKPDMLLTGENGWLGDIAHGPNKLEELRHALNDYLVTIGKAPVEWGTGKVPDWAVGRGRCHSQLRILQQSVTHASHIRHGQLEHADLRAVCGFLECVGMP
jgi:hypothetical protein